MEWRSHTTVQPIEVIEIHSEDLPPQDVIKIINKKP